MEDNPVCCKCSKKFEMYGGQCNICDKSVCDRCAKKTFKGEFYCSKECDLEAQTKKKTWYIKQLTKELIDMDAGSEKEKKGNGSS